MRVAEKTLFILVVITMVLRVMLMNSYAPVFVMALLALSFLYCYLGFALLNGVRLRDIFKKISYAGKPTMQIVGAIFAGVALSVSCIAVLFKFMSWPGYFMELLYSVLFCFVIAVITLYKMSGKYKQYYSGIMTRLVVAGFFCITLLVIPRKTFMSMLYRDHPAFLKAEYKAIDNPGDPQLEKQAWEVLRNERGTGN